MELTDIRCSEMEAVWVYKLKSLNLLKCLMVSTYRKCLLCCIVPQPCDALDIFLILAS